jgi:TolB protein
MSKTLLMLGVSLFVAAAAVAQNEITITSGINLNGFSTVKVNISGFSGEILSVLKDDLSFMGMVDSPADEAKYLIAGSNNGKVEGRVTERINKNQILAKSYNGGTTRAQTHAFADDIAKAITPNVPPIAQTKIAFKVETGGGNSEVYISDYDGFNARAITSDHSIIAQPCWAGRGAIYYTSYKLGNPFIYRHELSSGLRQTISHFAGLNSSAAVSPDGRRICMILSKNGSPDVYVADADGSNSKQLTFTREDESSPCWSPDGKTICYVSRESGAARLYTISASGGKATRIATTGVINPTEPDYSPDGRWIAFTSQARDFTICIVKAEGGEAIPLVSGEDPSWAPNSRALLFCKGPDHEKSLCLLDVPTKHVKTIHRILESNSYPSWAK